MKKRLTGAALAVAILAAASASQAKDATVMTVNGHAVPLSEFEYLYLKNRQQTALQPLDEYLEIFKTYKLKVADALALGLDTTAAFRSEYAQYRSELAQPYLVDSAYLNELIEEAYERYQTQEHARHIMLAKGPDAAANRRAVERLDSIRAVLAAGGDFAELATRFSQDRETARRGGDLGWMANPGLPYAFQTAVSTLPVGTVSEIVESPVGYHLILVEGRRPNAGYLSASHIMKMVPASATAEQQAAAKAQIDSIYAVIVADPEKFEEMAVRYSDDTNTGPRGGIMPPFPQGVYPHDFDSVAFSLADGTFAAPVRTPFGWHIIKRFSMRPLESLAQMRDRLSQTVTNPADIRADMIAARQLRTLGRQFGLRPVKKSWDVVNAYIAAHGIDSSFYPSVSGLLKGAPLYKYKGGQLTLADMAPQLSMLVVADPEFGAAEFGKRADAALRQRLLALKEADLERTQPDYRNLLHEFRDGSLLYEAGRLRVWDRATADTVGLADYFDAHRGEYTWKEPRAKGYLIQVANDSVERLVKARLTELAPAEYVPVLRKEFPGTVQIDRVLIGRGGNAMIDYLMFGGPEVKPSNSRYANFFLYDAKVLEAPEELADVRGLVVADYQNFLMKEWEEELKEKYPVQVFPKVLGKVNMK